MKKLLGVTVLSGMLTLLRMGSGFIVAKLVAVYAGPSGMAMLGQIQSLVTGLNGAVAAPTGTGVVRYTAENRQEGFESCAPWWKASLRWLLLLLAGIVPLACLAARPLADFLFGDYRYSWLVVAAALALPLSGVNTLLASVINGLEQYKRYFALSIASVCLATGLMATMIVHGKLPGALFAATIFSALTGCVMLAGVVGQPWFRPRHWWGRIDRRQFRQIGDYVAMAITTAVCTPVSQIVVRNILIETVGWERAGHWQAVFKISEAYLAVITLALSTYYLPRLASLKGLDAISRETLGAAKVLMPIVTIMAIVVYLLRDLAITLLFTEEFREARDLFAVQLVGDVIKILSWLFAYPMLSRGAAKWYIATEIVFAITFVALAYLMIPHYGAHGANAAYAANYLLYLIFACLAFKKFAA